MENMKSFEMDYIDKEDVKDALEKVKDEEFEERLGGIVKDFVDEIVGGTTLGIKMERERIYEEVTQRNWNNLTQSEMLRIIFKEDE